MNELYNFNPDDKRIRLADLLQDMTQPYQKYRGPMSSAPSGPDLGKLLQLMDKMNKAPVVDKSTPYDPQSQVFTPYEG